MKRSAHICSFAVVALAALALASQVVAQAPQPGGPPQGPPGGFGGPGGGPGGGGILGLAMREEVQQELQLVDEQKDKVRDIVDGARDKTQEAFRNLFEETRDLSDDERRAKFRQTFESLDADMAKELDKVLLPHQMERLKQIDLQNKIRQRGASALTGGDVAKALNLTDEQREKLEKRAVEVQQELQTKIRQLQLEARDKMLDVLSPDQQAQLKKMMGDQMDLKDQPFGGRGGFNRGGGPNGQGRGGRPPANNNESK